MPGPYRTLHHGIYNLEMRRVESQGQMHGSGIGINIGRKTLVVLNIVVVAFIEVDIALEFIEQVTRHLAKYIGEHIKAPTVGHTDDNLVRIGDAGLLHHPIHDRDQGFSSFQGKAFLPDIAGMQVFFEVLGSNDPVENPITASFPEIRLCQRGLDLYLDPAFFCAVFDMHVLETDSSAIDLLQAIDNLPQRRILDPE